MSEPEPGHVVFATLVAAGLGAAIATGIGYFVRKEDKTQFNEMRNKVENLERELGTIKDEEKKFKKDLRNVKRAVVQPDRFVQLTQALSEQTQQAQEMLESQVMEQDPNVDDDESSDTF